MRGRALTGESSGFMAAQNDTVETHRGNFLDYFIRVRLFSGVVSGILMISSVRWINKGEPLILFDQCVIFVRLFWIVNCRISLSMHGYPFTWGRGQGTNHVVEEKLDRAFVNLSWMQRFPHAILNKLAAPVSDHSPVELITKIPIRRHRQSYFLFENGWLQEEGMGLLVGVWKSQPTLDVMAKLHSCSSALSKWRRVHTTFLRNQINHHKNMISSIEQEDVLRLPML